MQKYKFLVGTRDWGRYVLLVCNETGGMYFTSDAIGYSNGWESTFHCNSFNKTDIAEIDFSEAMKLINPSERKKLLNRLGLPLPDLKISEEDIKRIIDNLKNSRAFNEDSALEVEDMKELDFYFNLAQRNVISEYQGRFYISP